MLIMKVKVKNLLSNFPAWKLSNIFKSYFFEQLIFLFENGC